jgi:hypothetical protein
VPFLPAATRATGVAVSVAGLGVGFGVGVFVSTGIGVGAGVALRRSLTAWAIDGPAVTPVTAVVRVMITPTSPMPIGPLTKLPSICVYGAVPASALRTGS